MQDKQDKESRLMLMRWQTRVTCSDVCNSKATLQKERRHLSDIALNLATD